MHKEWADKWVAALRSGEYKQGFGELKANNNSFCCLGVLCDIVVKETDSIKWSEFEQNNNDEVFYIEYRYEFIPEFVKNIADINTPQGIINVPVNYAIAKEIVDVEYKEFYELDDNAMVEIKLWELNDEYKFSFNDIANIIEDYWSDL